MSVTSLCDRLVAHLGYYDWKDITTVTLPAVKQTDLPYWVDSLLYGASANKPCSTPTEDTAALPVGEWRAAEQKERIEAAKKKVLARLDVIRPLLKTVHADDDELLSVDVLGVKVTITKAAAKSMGGEDSPFYGRFTR
ncbi:unnamed protein product [Vitrella brassicaformis CCMP3155]|uniref:Uncharacterized protein n=1 Tax=Vitrella brassicaformis (strain CCMP3155) TaxID=1169540 RepID=A0A0G4F288_VITBC|nr:unnamed protein product [Vitrella brassicaformis CCMP3155]|eukprot:CEM05741.1 unnamed protein product [Vitrella brassicaformis CCMP3155]